MRSAITVLVIVILTVVLTSSAFEARANEDLTFGAWTIGNPAPGHLLAVHSTLLRNGKILVVGGSSFNESFAWGKEEARLYDIATGTWSAPLSSPAPYGTDKDAFCSSHAHDNTGGVIFQGGLLGYGNLNGHGVPNSARYEPGGGFTPITGGTAHWYPTLVAGVNDIFIFPGRDTNSGENIEKLTYGTTAWTSTGVIARTQATYPRVALLPNGTFFVASPALDDRKNYVFDPGTNTLSLAGNDVVPESEPGGVHNDSSWKGSGVLLPLVPSVGSYPQMRFALINGVNAWVKDLGQANPVGSRVEFA